MHGSFVVCHNAVEMDVGFDNGIRGSITEDAYFAMLAWSKGIRFAWVDSTMYEQSPFTIKDFIYQRRRWFGGLLLIVIEPSIPLQYRLVLGFMILTWALSPLPVLITAIVGFVAVREGVAPSTWLIAITASIFCWNYVLGFVKTFDLRHGVMRYIVLLFLQLVLQPVFAIMEIAGVLAAIFNPPFDGFHIVKKEGKELVKKEKSRKKTSSQALFANSDGSSISSGLSSGMSSRSNSPNRNEDSNIFVINGSVEKRKANNDTKEDEKIWI
jgi:egghead protein (zeste-white 4 protein)